MSVDTPTCTCMDEIIMMLHFFFIHSLTVSDILLQTIIFHKDIGALDLNSLCQAAVRFQDSVSRLLLMVETMIMWQLAVQV